MERHEYTVLCRLSGTYEWQDGRIYESDKHTILAGDCNFEGCRRVYLRFEVPALPQNTKILRAELSLTQIEGADGGSAKLGVYRAYGRLKAGKCTPTCAPWPLDYSNPKRGACRHRFDVTALFAQHGKTARTYTLALRMVDESDGDGSFATFGGLPDAQQIFVLSVVYGEGEARVRIPAARKRGSCNLLCGHGFESFADLALWSAQYACDDFDVCIREAGALLGRGAAVFRSSDDTATESGLYQEVCLPASGNYVFSAYVRPLGTAGITSGVHGVSPGIYLRITCGGLVCAKSRAVTLPGGYVRLYVTFSGRMYDRIRAEILMDGFGSAAVDGAQLEYGSLPGVYNLLENGGFEQGLSGWTHSLWGVYADHPELSCDAAHASVRLMGTPDTRTYVCRRVLLRQEIEAHGVFTLSGFARVAGLTPATFHTGKEAPIFRLRARIVYKSEKDAFEDYTAEFCGKDGWQYAEVEFSKRKMRAVDRIEVYCEYGGSFGMAGFDRICLYCRERGMKGEINNE